MNSWGSALYAMSRVPYTWQHPITGAETVTQVIGFTAEEIAALREIMTARSAEHNTQQLDEHHEGETWEITFPDQGELFVAFMRKGSQGFKERLVEQWVVNVPSKKKFTKQVSEALFRLAERGNAAIQIGESEWLILDEAQIEAARGCGYRVWGIVTSPDELHLFLTKDRDAWRKKYPEHYRWDT